MRDFDDIVLDRERRECLGDLARLLREIHGREPRKTDRKLAELELLPGLLQGPHVETERARRTQLKQERCGQKKSDIRG